MAYRDLREFVKKLEKEGELVRVRAEVDPVLEIAEITQRVARDPKRKENSVGPALLFEKPKGSRVPLLVNTFGSVRRMELAFEVGRLEEVADRIESFLAMQSPQGLLDKIKMLPKLAELGSFFPKRVKDGDCKEVIRTGNDVNLLDFPILKCWPQDGGRFITWPLVFTRNPETGKRNVGMYRMQVYDERTTGMHWQTQKHGAEHFRRAREANPDGKIPVSRGHRLRSGDVAGGDAADPAGSRRNDVRGISAARAGRDGEVRDDRFGSSGECRDRARRLCRR